MQTEKILFTSLENKNISKALVEAQAAMPVIAFDSTNPYFNSRFASLGAIIKEVRPILKEHGLALIQFPASIEGYVGVTNRLVHESGEWMEQTVVIPLTKPEGKTQIAMIAGIDITYLRRYSYTAILGLATEEDTDGGVGDGYEREPKQIKPKKTYEKSFKGKKPAKTKPSEEPSSLEGLLEEFGHKWNKARALGNVEADLPKIKDPANEQEVLEKLADLEIILNESEGE